MNPIDQIGGHFQWATNQRLDSDDMNNMSKFQQATLYNLVFGRLFAHSFNLDDRTTDPDTDGINPFSGFLGDDCKVIAGGSTLELLVTYGIGFYLDTSETDVFAPIYKPIVVNESQTVTLDAHEAQPRIDLVSITLDDLEDTASTEDIFDGVSSFTPTSIDTRVLPRYSILVTKGTAAATPSIPATPAGHIALAQIEVPATSGDVTIIDVRAKLNLSRDIVAQVATHDAFVISGGVVSSDNTDLYVDITAGECQIKGCRFTWQASSLLLTAPGSGTISYKIFYNPKTRALGSSFVTLSTLDYVLLATVPVANTDTFVVNANIEDARVLYPISANQLNPTDSYTMTALDVSAGVSWSSPRDYSYNISPIAFKNFGAAVEFDNGSFLNCVYANPSTTGSDCILLLDLGAYLPNTTTTAAYTLESIDLRYKRVTVSDSIEIVLYKSTNLASELLAPTLLINDTGSSTGYNVETFTPSDTAIVLTRNHYLKITLFANATTNDIRFYGITLNFTKTHIE